MDIGKAFSYVFEDEEWITKVLIGGLVFLVPIVQFAAIGYMLKIAQNVAQGNPRPLPAWGDFGDHFMRGLYAFVIGIVYAIPILLIVIPYVCIVAASANGGRSGSTVSGLLVCIFVPLMIVLGVLVSMLNYAALARYVATNTLSEAFKFGEIIASVRRNLTPWLMMLLVGILAQFVGGLGAIACGVGVFFTAFYAYCVMGHALGQTVAQQNAPSGIYQAPQPPGYGPPPSYQ